MGHIRRRNTFGLREVDFVGSTSVGQRRSCDKIWMAGLGCVLKMTLLLTCAILLSVPQAVAELNNQEVKALNTIWRESGSSSVLGWGNGDPCKNKWTGVVCNSENTTVEQLLVSNMSLSGRVSDAVGELVNLTILDFSNNPSMSGGLPSSIGNLTKLKMLVLQYCNFTGELPPSIGNLKSLEFLGLGFNNFGGSIPPEIGNTNLTWMDITSNKFKGPIPISTNNNKSVGLDSIKTINHFHLSDNLLEGPVPMELFSPSLGSLLHLLLDNNNLNGSLPNVTSFPPNLNIIRVDSNRLTGRIPAHYGNSTRINELYFSDNQFGGAFPNFSSFVNLSLLDTSGNNFDAGPFPSWMTSLPNLTTLNLAFNNLQGSIPAEIFNLPNIQAINVSNNRLSGLLNFSGNTGQQLAFIALDSNNITGFDGSPSTTGFNISLDSNPICHNEYLTSSACSSVSECQVWKHPGRFNNSCLSGCKDGMHANPYTCRCAYPLMLDILMTAPMFSNFTSVSKHIETELESKLTLTANQVYISNVYCNTGKQVRFTASVFPEHGDSLPSSNATNIINDLGHHKFNLDEGPYLLPNYWPVQNAHKNGLKGSAIAAIAVGSAVGFLILAASSLFAVYYKKRADKLANRNPFASWGGGSAEFGEAPKLKGARWFSLAELKQYTDSWSNDFQIGEGGYGRVYRGVLPSGELVAIKRATAGSMQGANEFKTEIELLSRAHHRNLVGLVGFCYEGGEQALVYEFMSNGTLDDHLKGKADSPLTWDMRLDIATASARGIAYLHDHANPPIIHRDLKSPNILLNEKLVAKVADFGLSKLAPEEGDKIVYSMDVKGTLGYLDPEYYSTAILTDKSDIYSFGIVLLELLTARPPIDNNKFVVREFRTALDRGGIGAVRPLMDPTIRDAVSTSDLERYLKVVLPCVEDGGDNRPTISEVVRGLEGLDELPSAQGGPGSRDEGGHGGGKKVKFSQEDPHVINEGDDNGLLNQDNTFQYSGAYGMSTTVRPK